MLHQLVRITWSCGLILALAPLAGAQPAPWARPGMMPASPLLYPGVQAKAFDAGQLPWVPPVPPIPPVPVRGSAPMTYANQAYAAPSWAYGTNPYLPSTASSGNSGTTANPYTPMAASAPDKPLSAAGYQHHEPLLKGLADLKLADVHLQRGDLVSAQARMREKELQTLIQSVNANRNVYRNAEQLTAHLQQAGLLYAGERVIGYADGKVYALIGPPR